MKRTKAEQLEEINKSFKWEMEALKQELTSEAEGKISIEICHMQKAKDLRLLQQEDFMRKDIELEGEKMKRKIMNQFEEEKLKLE